MNRPTIGIIGGMGPSATVDLLEKVISAYPGKSDNDFPRMIVDVNTGIPSPTRFLLGEGGDPQKSLIASARFLEHAGAELILIACNTAHYFYSNICREVRCGVMNIMYETGQHLQSTLKRPTRVAVLSTEATYQSGLYQQELNFAKIELVPLPIALRLKVMEAIYEPHGVKSGNVSRARDILYEVFQVLRELDVELAILGCTELPVAIRENEWCGIKILDPTKILAQATVTALLADVEYAV